MIHMNKKMSETVIKVENLSKQYRLGVVGTGTISHDLNRWWYKVRGKKDPYLKVGETNDRSVKGGSEYVWALKDVGFEVKQGEVLGIIGKNGAGKSTLLKLLSRVTSPTTGEIKAKGRIASLLEVGTGFHPELTGRENIFLNGAILGMTKTEIKKNLEEIVDFSGTARFVDTPVKRYSSGMRVRLAFAVAAHLEPEILIVDEVLAVGDAEFQKKAIGKMQDVSSGGGRTVLFVSHSMRAISLLCHNCILLDNGEVKEHNTTEKIISRYLDNYQSINPSISFTLDKAPGNEFAKLLSVSALDHGDKICSVFDVSQPLKIKVEYLDTNNYYSNTAILHFKNENGDTLFATNEFNNSQWERIHQKKGLVTAICQVPAHFLTEGKIFILVAVGNYNPNIVHLKLDEAISFEIVDNRLEKGARGIAEGVWPGLIRPLLSWDIQQNKND